jgi:hypothetical protein
LTASQIRFVSDSIIIERSAEGEGFTNQSNRFDVNNDGHASPIDVLIVINSLRNGGARSLGAPEGGEGEASQRMYIDVNGDGNVSPIDILQVINELNRQSRSAAAEGEGPSESGSLDEAIDVLAEDITKRRKR